MFVACPALTWETGPAAGGSADAVAADAGPLAVTLNSEYWFLRRHLVGHDEVPRHRRRPVCRHGERLPGRRTRLSIYSGSGSELDRQTTWPFWLMVKTVVLGPTPTVTLWLVSFVAVMVI